jgi:RNA polymerase sigma-70 factor (ECF subfamily)
MWDWTQLAAVALAEARRVLDEHAARDATQEALIRAWRHAPQCRTPHQPAPWVRAIARREALRVATAQSHHEYTDDIDAGAEESATLDLRVDVGRAATQRLSRHERRLLAYRYWLDYSDSQIAATLNIPLGTAKIRLHRARRKLAAALQ